MGQPAPEVSIQPLDGEAVALSSLKGKVMVLDFWASWCQPCVTELPHLMVIDSQGTVLHVHLGSGPGTEQRLETELDALLPE